MAQMEIWCPWGFLPAAVPCAKGACVAMSSLEAMLRSSGWTAFALDSLSVESVEELASWMVALGYDAEDLPELRRLIRGSVAAVARDRRTFANASDASVA